MISPESDKKLFLLDAYALIFRAYYAFIRNPRINTKGMNTSAMFGFTNVLLDVLKNEKPSHLAVVFDPPEGNFRSETFADYKANREETPEDIRARTSARRRAEHLAELEKGGRDEGRRLLALEHSCGSCQRL